MSPEVNSTLQLMADTLDPAIVDIVLSQMRVSTSRRGLNYERDPNMSRVTLPSDVAPGTWYTVSTHTDWGTDLISRVDNARLQLTDLVNFDFGEDTIE